MKLEFDRNSERYEFMKWGMQAFDTFGVVPPASASCTRSTSSTWRAACTEARRLLSGYAGRHRQPHDDDQRHRRRGLGRGRHRGRGRHARPAVYFLTPDVVGVELKGKLNEGITATDLVLTVTEMLRKEKVVGKFVEFFGEGPRRSPCPTARRSPTWRRNTARRWVSSLSTKRPSTTCVATGRTQTEVDAFDRLLQGAGTVRHAARRRDRLHQVVTLDLTTIKPRSRDRSVRRTASNSAISKQVHRALQQADR
jgi:aconitate hydratase